MLELIRRNAQGIVIWVVVGFVILSLSSFILSSYIGDTVKNYVAKVNDQEISNRQFQIALNNYQQQLQRQLGENYSRFFNAQFMRESVTQGLVNNELLHQLSVDAGFRTGAQLILSRIENDANFKDESGAFSAKQYEEILQRVGYNKQSYEAELAQLIVQQQLNEGVSKTAFTLASTAKEFQRLEQQQREISYLKIENAALLKSVTLADDEIKSYYNTNLQSFMTEEQIKLAYIELDIKQLATAIEVDIDDILQHYEDNKAKYSKDDNAAAEKKIKQIEARIKKGEPFEKLAKELSQDPGSAASEGDLGFLAKGVLEKSFEDALFKLNKGEISKAVRDKYGYHLIKLVEIRKDERHARHILIKPEKIAQSFADVKQQIKKDLQLARAEKRFYEDADKLDKLSYEFQDSLEPAAERLGQKIKESPFITRRGGAQIWRNPDILSAAFSEPVFKESLNSELIKLSDEHVLVLRVKAHKPALQKPLETVKPQIEKLLQEQKSTQAAEKLAQTLLTQLQAGKSLEDLAAKDNRIALQNIGFIGRSAQFDPKNDKKEQVDAELRKAVFKMKKPTGKQAVYQKLVLANGDAVVVALKTVKDTSDADAKQLESIQRSLVDVYAKASKQALLDYMRAHSKVEIIKKDENAQD